jgi:ribosomal protein L23
MNPVRSKKPKVTADSAESKKTSNGVKLLALKPRVSEKGYALSEKVNTYIFDVPSDTNKFDISKAVASQFEVGVTNIRLASVPGKAVRSYRNRGRKSINGRRSAVRKAYVTLKAGDKLPIFAAVEEAEAPKETK